MNALTAIARCLRGCGVLAQGDPEATDKAAAKHSEKDPKHPTATETRPA